MELDEIKVGELVQLNITGLPQFKVKVMEVMNGNVPKVRVNLQPEIDMILSLQFIKKIEMGHITDKELDDYGIVDPVSRDIIKYRYSDKYTSVLDLYKIAVSNLKTKSDKKSNMYNITVDKNIMIPDSNTYLISIVKLLEFGNLEIQKYGLLENCMQYICDNLDTFYNKFKIEGH